MKRVKRLYNEFRPDHYDLYLEPDREKSIFSGRVTIGGRKAGRPSRRITLHQKDLKITGAKIIKKDKKRGDIQIPLDRINLHKSFDELRLHSSEQLYPGDYVIELDFSGKITENMHGIYPCNFQIDGINKQLIATQFESHHAREAFPCIDEPEAKATFQLTLCSPAGEAVVSNTPIASQSTKNKKTVTTFEKTPRMSSYLLAFAYGEMKYKESQTASGINVRVYATPDKVNLTQFSLDTAVKCLEFFEDYYGVAYPLPKMDLIGLPDFSAGAMENWGMVTFRESVLFYDPKSSPIETKQFVAMVISHEFAHQWFGNLVTMKWWNDLWLNESFAEMMGYMAADKLFPEWNMWRDFVQREVGSALNRDALPTVQAVQTEVKHPDELATLFDPSIVYAKGAALINTIRNLLGEDNFRKGLKNYFNEYQFSNTVADDLWRHLKEASGIDIRSIMKNWLEQPGFPLVSVDFSPKEAGFSVSQVRLVLGGNDNLRKMLWNIPLAASMPTDTPLLKAVKAEIKINSQNKYPLVLNHDGHSYFVARYIDPDHYKVILDAVKNGSLSAIDRLILIQNHLLLEKAGVIKTLDNLQLLDAYANDRDETIWGMLAGIIGNVRTLVNKDEELENKLNEFIIPLVNPLVQEFGWDGKKNDTSQTQKMRALAISLAAVAGDERVIAEGLKRFKEFKEPGDLAPDIRSAVYFIAVRYGSGDDFNRLLNLHNSISNADERDEIASELTSTRDLVKIKKLLSMISGRHVRLQDAPTWFAWMMRNRYATEQTWLWMKANWGWIEDKFGSDKSYDRFPRYAAMVFSYPKQLDAYKEFFKPRANIALKRAISLGAEEITNRIRWREINEAPVKQWLIERKNS